jgi:hypothetical protein
MGGGLRGDRPVRGLGWDEGHEDRQDGADFWDSGLGGTWELWLGQAPDFCDDAEERQTGGEVRRRRARSRQLFLPPPKPVPGPLFPITRLPTVDSPEQLATPITPSIDDLVAEGDEHKRNSCGHGDDGCSEDSDEQAPAKLAVEYWQDVFGRLSPYRQHAMLSNPLIRIMGRAHRDEILWILNNQVYCVKTIDRAIHWQNVLEREIPEPLAHSPRNIFSKWACTADHATIVEMHQLLSCEQTHEETGNTELAVSLRQHPRAYQTFVRIARADIRFVDAGNMLLVPPEIASIARRAADVALRRYSIAQMIAQRKDAMLRLQEASVMLNEAIERAGQERARAKRQGRNDWWEAQKAEVPEARPSPLSSRYCGACGMAPTSNGWCGCS